MKNTKKAVLPNELIIAVDFDGTITTCSQVSDNLELREDAKEVLERLYDDGVKLILWTCRTGEYLTQALEFLKKEDMLHFFSSVNENIPEVQERYSIDARKVGADIYIDDKNIFTKEINWNQIEEYIYGEEN